MTQYTLDGKELTPKENLLRLRMDYFTTLLQEMTLLRNKRIELIKNYKREVDSIDKQLNIIILRDKNRRKTL